MTATSPASPDTGSATTSYGELSAALGTELPHEVYTHAFTHRSFAYENGGVPTNERLEFLGDSVLGVVVTEALYRKHPDLSEGRLAKLRAAVVNMKALAGVARGLDLGRYILLGHGEETTGGRDKDSILADSTEALLGAAYLEHGFVATTRLIRKLFDPLMEQSAALGAGLDWKTSLQELVATLAIGVPEYVVSESGPDHAKSFEARVRVGEQLYGHGVGRSKKEAEQQAAETAWKALKPAEEATVEAADAADASTHA